MKITTYVAPVLLALTLSACGGPDEPEPTGSNEGGQPAQPAPSPAPEPSGADSVPAAPTNDATPQEEQEGVAPNVGDAPSGARTGEQHNP